jgi:hypothetical protein
MTEEENAFDKVKKGLKDVVGGTAGIVEGTAQGIKEAVEEEDKGTATDATDTDMDTSSFEEEKNRAYNEAGEELEDAGDNIKAGTKAVVKKISDSDKDLGNEYQKEKIEEKVQ